MSLETGLILRWTCRCTEVSAFCSTLPWIITEHMCTATEHYWATLYLSQPRASGAACYRRTSTRWLISMWTWRTGSSRLKCSTFGKATEPQRKCLWLLSLRSKTNSWVFLVDCICKSYGCVFVTGKGTRYLRMPTVVCWHGEAPLNSSVTQLVSSLLLANCFPV